MLKQNFQDAASPPTTLAAQRSCTLSGHAFSVEHHHLLRAVARTRGWPGAVWVPVQVAALLQLPLRGTGFAPVRLETDRQHALVYHSAQFVLPLAAMQARWHDHLRRTEEADRARLAGLLSAKTQTEALPLNTNGERFDEITEERILRHERHSSPGSSRYWTTAAEAAYLYAAPFSAAYLDDPANAVLTDTNPLCRPLRLYDAAGTGNPSRFSPASCRRYDAVNAYGHLYRPGVALRMKAFAIRHGCLHEPTWMTPRRVRELGRVMPSQIRPLNFFKEPVLELINFAVTSLASSRPAGTPQVRPAAQQSESCEVSEQRREKLLLLPFDSAVTVRHNMLRLSTRQLAFMAPGDFYALSQRSSFSSYTQFNDSCALARSFQHCSPTEKLACTERVEAINAEMERAKQTEAQLHMNGADATTPTAAAVAPTPVKRD